MYFYPNLTPQNLTRGEIGVQIYTIIRLIYNNV